MKKPWIRIVVVLLVAAAAWYGKQQGLFTQEAEQKRDTPAPKTAPASSAIEEAFRAKKSKVWVENEGTVVKLLRDDLKGSKHQQWLLKLASGHTLKFAHNIDLAPYIKTLAEGDRIRFRGRYEYNIKGGVVHWTHRDKNGRIEGGWIEHDGKRYE